MKRVNRYDPQTIVLLVGIYLTVLALSLVVGVSIHSMDYTPPLLVALVVALLLVLFLIIPLLL